MTHASLAPLIGPEFDPFLAAPIGEDRNGTTLSVLSALARLDVDPWREARALARMPRKAAAERLTALIEALPREEPGGLPSRASAADLVAQLPTGRTDTIRTSDSAPEAVGFRQTPTLMGLGAFVLIALIVLGLAISALYWPGSGMRADPSAPRAAKAAVAAPSNPGR